MRGRPPKIVGVQIMQRTTICDPFQIALICGATHLDRPLWAYLAIGEVDKAYESLAQAAENRALVGDIFSAQFTCLNFYSDPVLEEPSFVELRQKLRYTSE